MTHIADDITDVFDELWEQIWYQVSGDLRGDVQALMHTHALRQSVLKEQYREDL